jgi:hypothetical protein
MRAIGHMGKRMAVVVSFTQMAMCMRVNGKMTKHTAQVLICTRMELDTQVTGKPTNTTDVEKKFSPMELKFKASMLRAKLKEMALKSGSMARNTMENFLTMLCMATGPTLGQINEFTLVTGEIIWCMARAISFGKTAEDMKEAMNTTRNTVMVCLSGTMGENMTGNGWMESNTEMENIFPVMVQPK